MVVGTALTYIKVLNATATLVLQEMFVITMWMNVLVWIVVMEIVQTL
jgi:hypothetical protein